MKSSNSPDGPAGLVQMGKIIGVHGLAGGLKVYSYAESAQWAAPGASVSLIDDAGRLRRHRVVACQPYKKTLRVTLSDVVTREQAEALVGCGVFIDRADLPEPEEDTYYWVDVLGMEAVTPQGRSLGRVREIIATGANDVYVIRPQGGTEADEILVPAITSAVIEIDIANRRMIVEPPEGLE